jgi:glycosyltransferase involved in cell wall biosynthesis
MKRISVIIPTYNRLDLLKITLANIFKQSQPADEVIVVDDHSQDGTYEYLVSELKGKVIALQTKGKGPGAARNTGLTRATGDYIKFFDSDDVMTLNTLEVQAKLLNSSNSDFIYSPYILACSDGSQWQQTDVILQYDPIPDGKSILDCMAFGFFTVIPSMLFRREFLDKLGSWREDLVAYEDWDYLWRIGSLTPSILHTNKCAMLYRVHGSQTTENNFNHHQRDLYKQTCLLSLIHSPNLALNHRLLLEAEWWKTESILNKTKQPVKFQVINFYKRIRNKYERLRTHTNWERMHGPNADPEQFQHYLDLL